MPLHFAGEIRWNSLDVAPLMFRGCKLCMVGSGYDVQPFQIERCMKTSPTLPETNMRVYTWKWMVGNTIDVFFLLVAKGLFSGVNSLFIHVQQEILGNYDHLPVEFQGRKLTNYITALRGFWTVKLRGLQHTAISYQAKLSAHVGMIGFPRKLALFWGHLSTCLSLPFDLNQQKLQ